ncbi:MAG: fasciclin domain-containing protein [Prevotella sp.]|nr:fasciclin domain-containing protein [Prevotella sp.]
MDTKNIRKHLANIMICCGIVATLPAVTSCKEDIDESNLYTFTGETIEDYLVNRSDRFSSFNYILGRIGYDKILSAYGTYTCFAPTNEAVEQYVDSLYDDPVNLENPHNGMTQRGLEGLTDSLCEDIALFHLLATEVMGVNMGNGMTIKTMLGRDINTSIDPETGAVIISRASSITSMDNELENGILHEIDCVIRRSNMLIAGEMENNPDLFTIFSQALSLTGLADSLNNVSHTNFDEVDNDRGFYVPEKCELGYTIFAETDEVLAANGINNIDDLIAYANEAYGACADQGSGWYDYARNHNITVSTGTDYKNPWNALSMFVRYHILDFKLPYNKLVNSHNQISKVTLMEYYETMLPYTLLKITRNNGRLLLNRWQANSSLTDMVAELGTTAIHTVLFGGVDMEGQNAQIAAVNGYIHPLKNMLTYNENVPRGALNERLRFDDTAFLGEMMSNSFRRISDSEVNAMNGGKTGTDGNLSGSYIRIPPGFLKDLAIYNGDDTRLYYLSGQSSGWSNYQGDEFNCKGRFDFAFRLPPVPDGTYELRIGYTANGNRGMLQFYLGSSSELSSMKALDIPLDMRIVPVNSGDLTPDVNTGWCDWTRCDDKGVESDANMRNLGYMRGPLYYTVGVNSGNYARSNVQDLRRILAKQAFKQDEYWLRFKTVLEGDAWQFHLDYIEFCPENVYNNTRYVEDMY